MHTSSPGIAYISLISRSCIHFKVRYEILRCFGVWERGGRIKGKEDILMSSIRSTYFHGIQKIKIALFDTHLSETQQITPGLIAYYKTNKCDLTTINK